MTTHQKTSSSFATKSDQYLNGDCDGPPFAEHFAVASMFGELSGKRILCVGCGGGAECGALIKKGAEVIGSDPSAALLERARHQFPTVEFKQFSVEQIPFPDNAFDLVYCAHVLHYLNDWSIALHEIFRVLRPTGHAIITIHHPIDHGITNYLDRREVHDTWFTDFDVVFYPRSIGEMLNSFVAAGFSVKRCIEAGSTPEEKSPILIAFDLEKGC